MKNFPKYGSIEGLHKNNEVLTCAVVVTEKLHGSSLRFQWSSKDGLLVGSRNMVVLKNDESNHDGFGMGEWVKLNVNVEKLRVYENYTIFGEIHGSNIQKGVKYKDEKDFRVFDIRDPDGDYMDWDDVARICKDIGLKTVPVLLRGRVELADLEKIIEQNSQVAIENGIELEENVHEGVVIKPLKMRRDRRGNWLRAKYKSVKFAENAKKPNVKTLSPEQATLQDAAREFADTVLGPGRVAVIVDHITRDGDIELSMRRTPDFLRALIKDVVKEHPDIYEGLDKHRKNAYNKAVSSAAVPMWKKYILNNG